MTFKVTLLWQHIIDMFGVELIVPHMSIFNATDTIYTLAFVFPMHLGRLHFVDN